MAAIGLESLTDGALHMDPQQFTLVSGGAASVR
jgi:hypothetical protein